MGFVSVYNLLPKCYNLRPRQLQVGWTVPHFAQVEPNIFSAYGYSGHGVALATLAGKITAAAIAGQAEDFDVVSRVPTHRFPGGRALRSPSLKLAMTWYAMRDRLGF